MTPGTVPWLTTLPAPGFTMLPLPALTVAPDWLVNDTPPYSAMPLHPRGVVSR